MWTTILRFIIQIELGWWIFVESSLFVFSIAVDQAVVIETARAKGTIWDYLWHSIST